MASIQATGSSPVAKQKFIIIQIQYNTTWSLPRTISFYPPFFINVYSVCVLMCVRVSGGALMQSSRF